MEIGLLIQDDVGCADGATLFMTRDNREQMCDRVGNYDISTEARELKIQWINVLLLMHAGIEPQEELPPPIGQIKFSTRGAIIGRGYIWRAIPPMPSRKESRKRETHGNR